MNKEEIIFEMYKDKPIKNAKTFKSEIKKKFKNINVRDLFVRINNYQVKKYGGVLDVSYQEDTTTEEAMKTSSNARMRRYSRRKK